MFSKVNRRKFLNIGGTATAGIIVGFNSPLSARPNTVPQVPQSTETVETALETTSETVSSDLLVLDADPPRGTKAVRYYMGDIRVSELTNIYAEQTNSKPVWKTVVDPAWFEPGKYTLKIEADTPSGSIELEKREITITHGIKAGSSRSLTGAWKICAGDGLKSSMLAGTLPEVVQAGFDDRNWDTVLVPNSIGYLNQKWNDPDGIIAVYRKTFELDSPRENEQISITLESCYWMGRVFINGAEVGQTKGGYLPSRYDITKNIKHGKNVVAAIVDNRKVTMGVFETLHIYYWNWGGLLQGVHIDRNPDIALTDLRAEGSGSGVLRLWPTVVNKKNVQKQIDCDVAVYDPSGTKVLTSKLKSVVIPPDVDGLVLDPIELKINSPQLWDIGNAKLYTIVVSGNWGNLTERTGFRDIEVRGGDMLLNGKVIENLQGFNRHADYPGLGRTQVPKLQRKELQELYDRGFRIFRPAHYPTTPALLDAADELGMLVIEEINVTGLNGDKLDTREVKDFAAQQLTKMIHRDRSHPSIIAWSVGNENLTDEPKAANYIRETILLGRKLDQKRLFTHVTWKAEKDITYQYQDFVAQNFYAGWYSDKVEDVVDVIDKTQTFSGKPVLLSEYGAEAIAGRMGMGYGSEFYQSFIIDEHNRLLNDRKHFIGKLYWTSTEFWCRPGWDGGSPAPVPPFHCKAIQSYYRNEYKLGWRVMFSPVRIAVNTADKFNFKQNQFGGEIKITSKGDTVVELKIVLTELKGKVVEGIVSIIPSVGFKPDKMQQSFKLNPNEVKSITLSLKGKLPDSVPNGINFIKAVVDADTEAHPYLLTMSRSDS